MTLACDDGQVVAHRLILALSGPLLKKLLEKNKHPHSLIYMRGLNSEDLMATIDFQENLDSFLAMTEELRLPKMTEELRLPKMTRCFSSLISPSL